MGYETGMLSVKCRCGHPRRFHNSGTIFVGYETNCLKSHADLTVGSDYRGGHCHVFEAEDGWEEALADKLRSKGWLVERVVRDPRGRFAPRQAVAS